MLAKEKPQTNTDTERLKRLAQHEFGKCNLPDFSSMPDVAPLFGAIDKQLIATRNQLRRQYAELAQLNADKDCTRLSAYVGLTMRSLLEMVLEQSRKDSQGLLPYVFYRQKNVVAFVRHKLGERGLDLKSEAIEQGVRRALDFLDFHKLIHHSPGGHPAQGYNRPSMVVLTHYVKSRHEAERVLWINAPKDPRLMDALAAIFPKRFRHFRDQVKFYDSMTPDQESRVATLRKELKSNYINKQKLLDGFTKEIAACGKLVLPLQNSPSLRTLREEELEDPQGFDFQLAQKQLKQINNHSQGIKRQIHLITTKNLRQAFHKQILRLYESQREEWLGEVATREAQHVELKKWRTWKKEEKKNRGIQLVARRDAQNRGEIVPLAYADAGPLKPNLIEPPKYAKYDPGPDPIITDVDRQEGAQMFKSLIASLGGGHQGRPNKNTA